jgi:hypothetical protein
MSGRCKECERRRSLLEDVVNELDVSEIAIEKHGPLGTEPAELVRLVLVEKDLKIAALKSGMTDTADLAYRMELRALCKQLWNVVELYTALEPSDTAYLAAKIHELKLD